MAEYLCVGNIIIFIGVPVIGIITFIIRRIAKVKSNSNLMRYTFLALWILGIFCFVSLIFSVGRDFKSTNTINEQNITLTNPGSKETGSFNLSVK